jgi:hypothetical protein
MSGGWNIIQATTPYMKMYSIKLINTTHVSRADHILYTRCAIEYNQKAFSVVKCTESRKT